MINGSVVHKTIQAGSHSLSGWLLSSSVQTLPCGFTSGRTEAEPQVAEVGGEGTAHAVAQTSKGQACRQGPGLSAIAGNLGNLRCVIPISGPWFTTHTISKLN